MWMFLTMVVVELLSKWMIFHCHVWLPEGIRKVLLKNHVGAGGRSMKHGNTSPSQVPASHRSCWWFPLRLTRSQSDPQAVWFSRRLPASRSWWQFCTFRIWSFRWWLLRNKENDSKALNILPSTVITIKFGWNLGIAWYSWNWLKPWNLTKFATSATFFVVQFTYKWI